METKVTFHGRKRVKQRCGIPKRAANRNADIAFEKGLRHKDASGKLKEYLDKLFLYDLTANNMRVWNGSVYIFSDNRLVTVYPLPPNLRKAAKYKMEKKRKEEETQNG